MIPKMQAISRPIRTPNVAALLPWAAILASLVLLPPVPLAAHNFMEEPVWGDYLFWSIMGVAAAAGVTYGLLSLTGR
jgi:hypothetical protein